MRRPHIINLRRTLGSPTARISSEALSEQQGVPVGALAGEAMQVAQPAILGIIAVEVVPPRQTSREVAALETGMAALAHALDRPIALELAGTPNNRRFIARATDAGALAHLVRQLRARYPQTVVRPLTTETDPLRLGPGEAITAVELLPGADPYLPLRTPKERELTQEGADPLLGLVAAFGALPPGHRAIAQLALLPASDVWSAPHQRLAVEHPLEPERARERWEMANVRMDLTIGDAGLGLPAVLGLLALVGLATLIWRNAARLPLWMRQDVAALVHRQPIHLTQTQSASLIACAGTILLSFFALLVAAAWVRSWLHTLFGRTPLYDQRLVQEKITRVAYRARLRLLVIGPERSHPPAEVMGSGSGAISSLAVSVSPSMFRTPGAAPLACVMRSIVAHIQAGAYALSSHTRGRVRRAFLLRLAQGLVSAPQPARARLARRCLRTWKRSQVATHKAIQERQMDARTQSNLRRVTLDGFIGAYRQFHLATGGYFAPHWLSTRAARRLVASSRHAHRYSYDGRAVGWTRGLRRSPHLLSVADVAALWHLPQAEDLADLPLVERTRARTLLVPDALARPAEGFRIGSSAHAGHTLPVLLPRDALRRNALAVAKTGKGKSTLLLALARAALAEVDGGGLVLIDPHGDLAETVLAHVPEGRRDDTLLVDLGDRDYPIGLNLLDATLFPDRDKAVSNMIAVFSQIWKDFWGPRMESALEAALKTLYEANLHEVASDLQDGPDRQYTLLDATPLLTFTAFRHSLLARVRDPALTEYWLRFEALQARLQQDIITPVTTKLDKFANSFVARRIVGQGRSTLNIAEAIGRGQVVLVKTARGVVGHDTAALIGATLLGLLQVTLGEQANLSAGVRSRVRVLVDEFQTLEGVDFGAMLAELRKFGASFALATQALAHLDALDRTLRPTVLANVDQLFCYAMSAEDARMLEREFDGVVDPTDLINLDDFSCYARLTVEGRRVPVFSLALDPPTRTDAAQRSGVEELRWRSQRRIGREVSVVDTLIAHAAVRRKAVAEQQQHAYRRQEQGGQPNSEAGVTAMKTMKQASSKGAPIGRTGAEDGQVPEGVSMVGGREKRSGTRSHWKRSRRGKRHPDVPPFESLLLSTGDMVGPAEADDPEADEDGDNDGDRDDDADEEGMDRGDGHDGGAEEDGAERESQEDMP